MYSQNKLKLSRLVWVLIMFMSISTAPIFVAPAQAATTTNQGIFWHFLAVITSSNTPEVLDTASTESAASESVTIPEELDPFELTSSTANEVDERAVRLDAYFAKKKMPLAGYGGTFIEAANQCGMDWQLLPAIAVRESSGGKRMRLNNPFGWASAKIGFNDLNESIMAVGKHLCGLMPSTSRYYKDTTTSQKLYYYNGTVSPSYPREVLAIMNMF